ncbi:hypothetical protein BC943DRAFT_267626, partial [Umbelopsis sp. AD052]
DKFVTLGYARKFPAILTYDERQRLLQSMVDKLYFRLKCEEVFVSPESPIDDPILRRDSVKETYLRAGVRIKGCHGYFTDLTNRIKDVLRPVRLVIIGCIGLSISPSDIRAFL